MSGLLKVFISLLLLPNIVLAGVAFEGQLGSPTLVIENEDGTNAYYGGLSLLGKLKLPILSTKGVFGAGISLSGRYVDVTNNASSASQREAASFIGLGGGIEFNFYRLFLGADSYFVKSRHYFIGTTNKYLEYEMNITNIYGGVKINLSKGLALALSYSIATALVPKNITNLTNDLNYSDTTIWIHFVYDTNQSTGTFLKTLFN